MPARIPIKAAKKFAQENECKQVIVLAWDGKRTHVVTYGETLKDCEQAAIGGNKIKREILHWPEELCKAQPRRVRNKKKKENNNERQPV